MEKVGKYFGKITHKQQGCVMMKWSVLHINFVLPFSCSWIMKERTMLINVLNTNVVNDKCVKWMNEKNRDHSSGSVR